jgi:hypothetical protein
MTDLATERSGLIDGFLDSYICWCEACADVWSAYRRWAGCEPEQRRLEFAAYQSALDREERAAGIHCEWAERLGTRAKSYLPPP